MGNLGLVGKVTTLGILLVAIALTSGATAIPVRGGSGYGSDLGAPGPSSLGPNFGFSDCQTAIINFLNGANANNCEGYVSGTFTIGGTPYAGDQFAFLESGGTAFGILDVLTINANPNLTLSLVNPTLQTGVFLCGSNGTSGNPEVAQDSQGAMLTGLSCTPGSSDQFSTGDSFAGTQDGGNVQVTFSTGGVTFTNAGDPIAIFTTDGNLVGSTFTPGTPVSAPEPSSMILLGAGLLGVWGGRKRRLAR